MSTWCLCDMCHVTMYRLMFLCLTSSLTCLPAPPLYSHTCTLGCFRKSTFLELEVAIFFSVYKYYEKSSGKNSGHLEVIWPPHWMMANFLPNRPPRGLNRLYSRMVQDIDAIFCQTPAFMLYYVFFTSSMHKPCISGFSIFFEIFFISKKMFFFR